MFEFFSFSLIDTLCLFTLWNSWNIRNIFYGKIFLRTKSIQKMQHPSISRQLCYSLKKFKINVESNINSILRWDRSCTPWGKYFGFWSILLWLLHWRNVKSVWCYFAASRVLIREISILEFLHTRGWRKFCRSNNVSCYTFSLALFKLNSICRIVNVDLTVSISNWWFMISSFYLMNYFLWRVKNRLSQVLNS